MKCNKLTTCLVNFGKMLHIRHEEFNLSRLFDEIFEGRSKYVDETFIWVYICIYLSK